MSQVDLSETDFARQVEDLFDRCGWWWFHSRPAMKADGTWVTAYSGCDGVVRDGRDLCIELKSRYGKTSPAQQEWLYRASLCPHVEVYLWRPAEIDEIIRILR
jgi:hypothetical protein